MTRSKWIHKQGALKGKIPADAITADLRTQQNRLSLWEGDITSRDSVNDVALAIAAGRERVDKIELVWVTDEELKSDGLMLVKSVGRTPVTDLASRHFDACELDHEGLGLVAHRVASVMTTSRYYRLTAAAVRRILTTAVKEKRVDLTDLEEKVRTEVAKHLPN